MYTWLSMTKVSVLATFQPIQDSYNTLSLIILSWLKCILMSRIKPYYFILSLPFRKIYSHPATSFFMSSCTCDFVASETHHGESVHRKQNLTEHFFIFYFYSTLYFECLKSIKSCWNCFTQNCFQKWKSILMGKIGMWCTLL